MILDMGNMTLELYDFGGMHTDSDIMVFVPEEGLLSMGDQFPDPMLPYVSRANMADLPVSLEHWGRIVEGGRELKHVTMAHWDMPISIAGFKEQYHYLKTLWDGLEAMQREGKTLEDAKREYTIEEDFPFFKDKILKIRDIDLHSGNIEAIWQWQAGK